MSAELIRRAAARLREDAAAARAMDEHLDGHERPYNTFDPTDPAVVAERCDHDAELLDEIARWLRSGFIVPHSAIEAAKAHARTILRENGDSHG